LDIGSDEKKRTTCKEFCELEANYRNAFMPNELKPNLCLMMKQLKKENGLNVNIPDDNNDDDEGDA